LDVEQRDMRLALLARIKLDVEYDLDESTLKRILLEPKNALVMSGARRRSPPRRGSVDGERVERDDHAVGASTSSAPAD
jgi:hypothetical protein